MIGVCYVPDYSGSEMIRIAKKTRRGDMLGTRNTVTGINTMQTADMKNVAHQLIDQLPEGSTWNDVIYEMVVRREIESGLEDSDAGRTTSVEDVRKEFGLDQ